MRRELADVPNLDDGSEEPSTHTVMDAHEEVRQRASLNREKVNFNLLLIFVSFHLIDLFLSFFSSSLIFYFAFLSHLFYRWFERPSKNPN